MDEGRQTLPENQLRNLFNNLDADIDELLNTDAELTRPRAFMLTCLNWLGYQIDSSNEIYAENLSGKVIDGPGDGGIDFYALSDETLAIYQFKGSERTVLVRDASRPSNHRFIAYSCPTKNIEDDASDQNLGLRIFKRDLRAKVRQFYVKPENENKKFQIRISFVASGELSEQAEAEFLRLSSENKISVLENECEIFFDKVFASDILQQRWMETNSTWRDVTGNNRDYFECTLMRLDDNLIDDTKCRIFFANAHDLIKAYEALGHRIFESNVRCKLKSSSINDKIAESIRTEKGIREFHLLNNGLTICANSISIRSSKVRFNKPGIVNGLQTITTLAATYPTLSENLKQIFEINVSCW